MWSVEPAAVTASAATETGISTETAAAAAAAAPALLGVLPMGADEDSAIFCAALVAAGGEYLGVAGEHAGQRQLFAGAQGLTAATYTATEAARAAALLLG